jgi:hypothetical protein
MPVTGQEKETDWRLAPRLKPFESKASFSTRLPSAR